MREFRILLDEKAPHLSRFAEIIDGAERALTFGAVEDLVGAMRYGASAQLAHEAALKLAVNQMVSCRSGGTAYYFVISEHDVDAHGNIRVYGRECDMDGVIKPGAAAVWIHAPHLVALEKQVPIAKISEAAGNALLNDENDDNSESPGHVEGP